MWKPRPNETVDFSQGHKTVRSGARICTQFCNYSVRCLAPFLRDIQTENDTSFRGKAQAYSLLFSLGGYYDLTMSIYPKKLKAGF
jgi:hypothetical protein